MNAHNTTMAKALKSMREQQANPSEIGAPYTLNTKPETQNLKP